MYPPLPPAILLSNPSSTRSHYLYVICMSLYHPPPNVPTPPPNVPTPPPHPLQDNLDSQSQNHESRTFPDEGRDDVISCMGLTNDFLIFATTVCYRVNGKGGNGEEVKRDKRREGLVCKHYSLRGAMECVHVPGIHVLCFCINL